MKIKFTSLKLAHVFIRRHLKCTCFSIRGTALLPVNQIFRSAAWFYLTLLLTYSDLWVLDSSCDKLSCGGLRECVLMNNKPTCSLSTWKAAAVVVAGTVGAAASVAAGVAAFKLLSTK